MRAIWDKIIRFLFRKPTQSTQREYDRNDLFTLEYKDIRKINFNAIFSNKFAKYTLFQSKASIEEKDKKSKYINSILKKLWKKMKKITSMAFGCGGVAIIPYVENNKIVYKYIEQNRLSINSIDNDVITSATILAETKKITTTFNTKTYIRWSNYDLVNGNLIITQKYTDNDGDEIERPDFWKDITPELMITNCDRVLIAFLKSPIDNRDCDDKYGVPITYGCKDTIDEIYECLEQIRREFNLKQTFVGADVNLFKDSQGKELSKDGLYQKINGDKEDFWEIFDPAIRESSYYARLQELYTRLENEIGSSRGVLTKVEGTNATATEIKHNTFDSFTIVDDMRGNIEEAIDDFIYSCNKLCEAYGLYSGEEPIVIYDWDYSMQENSQETFNQINTGISKGYAKKVEGRQFLFPSESIEESEKAIEEIESKNPTVKELIGGEE